MQRPSRPTTRVVAILLGLALLAAACSSGDEEGGERGDTAGGSEAARDGDTASEGNGDGEDQAEAIYPGEEWAAVEPAAAGFDPAALDRLAGEAQASGSFCLLVTRHGQLAGEWYWNGADATTPREVFSTTKSFTSTLVGMAQAEGDLDIDDSAAEYIPEWEGTPSEEVTVKNLLSNDSGRHWDGGTDYGTMPRAPDRTQFSIDLAQDHPPGTTWVYNNAAIQTLDQVFESATGEQPAEYAAERLFEPLGMASTEMTTDNSGNTNMFFGLQSTCRDLARFGYLFLRQGNWDGEQIVPGEWVEEATGRSSQDINAGYGYLWWLNRRGPLSNPVEVTTAEQAAEAEPAQMAPGAPEDMYWALGLGSQIVQVDPGSDTVVVRLGPGRGGPTDFGPDFTARVVTEVLVDPDA